VNEASIQSMTLVLETFVFLSHLQQVPFQILKASHTSLMLEC